MTIPEPPEPPSPAVDGSGYVPPPPPEPVETVALDRKSTRLNSSHSQQSRMPSSA